MVALPPTETSPLTKKMLNHYHGLVAAIAAVKYYNDFKNFNYQLACFSQAFVNRRK